MNITHEAWDKYNKSKEIIVEIKNKDIKMPFGTTFGDVGKGKPLIMKDDYGRIQIALNQDSFNKKYKVKIGDDMVIK